MLGDSSTKDRRNDVQHNPQEQKIAHALDRAAMTRIVIAGGTGLIGRALSESLIRDGFDVDILTRRMTAPRQVPPAGARTMAWNPANPDGLPALARALAGCHAVVNLTGVPVGPLPWTAGRRRSILASRVEPTNYLVEAMTSLAREDRPAVFVGASGTDGYTGIDDAPATEETDITATTGFLADVGRAWEAAALGAEALGVRVVLVRTAFVLARTSALLPLLALPVRLGFGGRLGTGRQWFSWVHIDDLIGAYRLAIFDPGIAGPLLGAAPEPCQQRDLVETLARVLRRPNWLPMPGWLLRLVLREEATLLLGSRRVVPSKLLAAGYTFRYADLESALREALERPATTRRSATS